MTTIELQQWRESFVERYLNKIDDMEISEELERAAKDLFQEKDTPPLRNPLARGDDSRGTEIGRRRPRR